MQGGTLAAIDAIALFESGADRLCTETFGVMAPRELREARRMAREVISREYARPVSYTHLDVYKRQAAFRPRNCP